MVKVFLDTCVLYPPILRNLLLGLADAGLFDPLWSESVAAEWLHVTARKKSPGAPQALARMLQRWPDAVTPAGEPEAFDLPDAADRHVLAGDVAGGADILMTLNLRDFPIRSMDPFGIRLCAPDAFVMELWLQHPQPIEEQVAQLWDGLEGRALRNAMKRARLPRLAKALEQG